MSTVIPISKRGTITLPPAIRRSLGLDNLSNPMLIIAEQDGKIIMEPATALPIRDIPQEKITSWIMEDESAMEQFKKSTRKK